MDIFRASVLLILVVASYVTFIYLTRKHRVITLVLLTSFWVIILFFGYGFVYFVNPELYMYTNTFIRPSEVHLTYGEEHAPLPLPPATALRYRYSHEGAKYYCRTLSVEEVIKFYSQRVPGVKIESRESENTGISLLLKYQEAAYSVHVTPTGRSASDILVESVSPDW